MQATLPKKFYYICFLVSVIFSFAAMGCAKKTSPENEAVRINDYSLTAGEFNGLFSELKPQEDTPQAREKFLENLVTRKIILQEGEREGLDKQKDFLKSIENFWEQSLIKIVVDKKMKEISKGIDVSDQEIKDYYDKWLQQNPGIIKSFDDAKKDIKWQILKKKQSQALDSWIDGLRSGATIKIDKKAAGVE